MKNKKITTILIICLLVTVSSLIILVEATNDNNKENSNIKEYVWKYSGTEFKLTVDLNDIDLDFYSNADRQPNTDENYRGSNIIDFVADEHSSEILTVISEKLIESYEEKYNIQTLGQDYADFVLSFIQSNFQYELDFMLYHSPDYIAYSIETIVNGAGDCEDFSVLYSSIMYESGFNAGIVVYRNHIISAIELDTFEEKDNNYELSVFYQEINIYYGCETTPGPYIPVGYIDSTLTGDYIGRLYVKEH